MGGKSSSKSSTTATNTDNRIANQDGLVLSNTSANGATVNYNSTDAVKAIAQLGADTIRATGGAVVDLTAFSIDRNLNTLDNTVNKAALLTDSLIKRTIEGSTAAINAANVTSSNAIASANAQVRDANTQATKVTADTLAGARDVIASQAADLRALTEKNTGLAFSLAGQAVSAFQPGDNKASDNITKIGIAAAIAAVAFVVFKR